MNVWVTGGSSGIGFATAHRLAHLGHEVLALSRRGDAPPRCRAGVLDVANERLELMIERHLEKLYPEGVILAAGMGAFVGIHETTRERLRGLAAVNLEGPILLASRLIVRWRRDHVRGRIVFVTSTSAGSRAR